MKKKSIYRAALDTKITIPVWAKRINVREYENGLEVSGEGEFADVAVQSPTLKSRGEDFLSLYTPFELHSKGGAMPPHIEFARAEDVGDQINFIRRYGPVWGKVQTGWDPIQFPEKVNDPIKRDKKQRVEYTSRDPIYVRQNLKSLQKEQRNFRLLTALVAEVGKKDDADLRRIEAILDEKINFKESRKYNPMLQAIMDHDGISPVFSYETKEDDVHMYYLLTYFAHWFIGDALDRFPPRLTFFAGQPCELPLHRREGVLPILYFMLRKDYLSQNAPLRSCANCSEYFKSERSGQNYCSPHCSALHRGRKYWGEKGSKLRIEKRNKRSTKR